MWTLLGVASHTHRFIFHLLMFGVCLANQVRLFKFQLAVLVLLKYVIYCLLWLIKVWKIISLNPTNLESLFILMNV